ncbi:hypothetical protein BDV3_000072 [Batrachochytrium dendrobatidis]
MDGLVKKLPSDSLSTATFSDTVEPNCHVSAQASSHYPLQQSSLPAPTTPQITNQSLASSTTKPHAAASSMSKAPTSLVKASNESPVWAERDQSLSSAQLKQLRQAFKAKFSETTQQMYAGSSSASQSSQSMLTQSGVPGSESAILLARSTQSDRKQSGLKVIQQQQFEYEELEQNPDWVYDKLVSMGFNAGLAAHAVQGAIATLARNDDHTNLLRCALYIAFLNSLEDPSEPRSVQFQFRSALSKSQPMHRSLKPQKSILRNHLSLDDSNRGKNMLRKNWFDKAIGSLGLGPSIGKKDKNANGFGSLFTKTVSPTSASTNADQPVDTTLTPISPHNNNTTFGTINNGKPVENNGPDSITPVPENAASSTATPELSDSAHLQRCVRFKFPDVAIPPERLIKPTNEKLFEDHMQEVDIDDQADIIDLNKENTLSKTVAAAETAMYRNNSKSNTHREKQSFILKKPNEFTPTELHQYYMQLLAHDDRKHVPALINILRESVETNTFPKSINLSGISITVAHAKAFVELLTIDFGLQSLNLNNCNLDDETLKMLLQSILGSTTLSWLSLSNNPKVTFQGVKYIAVFLKKSPSIRYLNISGIFLENQGASYINHALSADGEKGFRQSCLEVLYMDNTNLKSAHLEIMIQGICRSKLTHLCIRRNALSPAAGKHIARILEYKEDSTGLQNSSRGLALKFLNLQDNDIGSGVVDIAHALALNRQLVRLNFQSIHMDAAGFIAVINAMNINSTLRTLDVGNNYLFSSTNSTVIEGLKQMLLVNNTISGLLLSNTNMQTSDIISLSEVLPLSKSIQKLDLSHNNFQAAGLMALAAVMNSNARITHIALSPLKPIKENEATETDIHVSNALDNMSKILNRNANTQSLETLDTRLACAIPSEEGIPSTGVEGDDSDSDTPMKSSLSRRDSLLVQLNQFKSRRSMESVKEGAQNTSMSSRSMLKDAAGSSLEVEKRLSTAEATATVLTEMLDLMHMQMQSGVQPSKSQRELLKQLRDESLCFQNRLQHTIDEIDGNVENEHLMAKTYEISDHIDQTFQRYDEVARVAVNPESKALASVTIPNQHAHILAPVSGSAPASPPKASFSTPGTEDTSSILNESTSVILDAGMDSTQSGLHNASPTSEVFKQIDQQSLLTNKPPSSNLSDNPKQQTILPITVGHVLNSSARDATDPNSAEQQKLPDASGSGSQYTASSPTLKSNFPPRGASLAIGGIIGNTPDPHSIGQLLQPPLPISPVFPTTSLSDMNTDSKNVSPHMVTSAPSLPDTLVTGSTTTISTENFVSDK